ncbi:MAG: TolC family protein [Ignavibacteria bacterium]|jgi:outer membrane protein TolC|nr:TolC family protein [Ignavibacteria bacterium]MCU7498762.1 TolC family protein [Ignavibacteria bacterium]MCU7512044.1 TolC family protein [Ignavibacteria bacterium]MCU7520577.1 TolC family protein [Ignavibacteria bacterium]MCU7523475.1 TolC family protein [Ignavibacteria bacterium]
MKNTLLALLVIFVFAHNTNAQGVSADSISLTSAIELTLQNHPAIKQAQSLIGTAEARIKQQSTSYQPEVEADASYTRIGPVPSFQFGGLSAKLYPENNYDAHLSGKYLVYDFGQRDAVRDLTASYKYSAQDNLEVIKTNLSYQTVQAFYSLLFLKQSLTVKDQQIADLNSHLQVTQAKVSSGTATDFDVSTTEVRVSSAMNQKTDILNEISKQEIILRSLMGLQENAPVNVSGSFNFVPETIKADSLINVAINQRGEVKLARDLQMSADKQKNVARMSDKPTVSLGAAYGFKNGYIPNLDVLRGNWTAAVIFRYPIYNGERSRYLLEEAEANLQSSLAHTSDVALGIRAEVNRAVSDINAAKQQLETVRIQVLHAQKALQKAELQYRDGVISNLDLLDAQTGLTEARLSELQIIYKNIMSRYQLQRAAGDKLWKER